MTATPAANQTLDEDQLTLSLQQPWGELIMCGAKTIEVRSVTTKVRGRIYLYVGQKFSRIASAEPELIRHGGSRDALPFSKLIGSVELVDVTPALPEHAAAACVPAELLSGMYAWHLRNPVRLVEPVTVRYLPYGVWFYPFARRG